MNRGAQRVDHPHFRCGAAIRSTMRSTMRSRPQQLGRKLHVKFPRLLVQHVCSDVHIDPPEIRKGGCAPFKGKGGGSACFLVGGVPCDGIAGALHCRGCVHVGYADFCRACGCGSHNGGQPKPSSQFKNSKRPLARSGHRAATAAWRCFPSRCQPVCWMRSFRAGCLCVLPLRLRLRWLVMALALAFEVGLLRLCYPTPRALDQPCKRPCSRPENSTGIQQSECPAPRDRAEVSVRPWRCVSVFSEDDCAFFVVAAAGSCSASTRAGERGSPDNDCIGLFGVVRLRFRTHARTPYAVLAERRGPAVRWWWWHLSFVFAATSAIAKKKNDPIVKFFVFAWRKADEGLLPTSRIALRGSRVRTFASSVRQSKLVCLCGKQFLRSAAICHRHHLKNKARTSFFLFFPPPDPIPDYFHQ